jgi:hypothetical protein
MTDQEFEKLKKDLDKYKGLTGPRELKADMLKILGVDTAAKPKKEKKTGPAKPGVIATIVSLIEKEGPISKEVILSNLEKAFPERDAEGMKKTINVQIPNRIRKEKNETLTSTAGGEWYFSNKTDVQEEAAPAKKINKSKKK